MPDNEYERMLILERNHAQFMKEWAEHDMERHGYSSDDYYNEDYDSGDRTKKRVCDSYHKWDYEADRATRRLNGYKHRNDWMYE